MAGRRKPRPAWRKSIERFVNSAKQEKVEGPNISRSHGIGRLDDRVIFKREGELATVKVESPSSENCGGRVGSTSFWESEKVKNLRQHLLILLHATSAL